VEADQVVKPAAAMMLPVIQYICQGLAMEDFRAAELVVAEIEVAAAAAH
jgi:hypothetical protein